MGISDGGGMGLAAIAWVVAGALALALGSMLFGIGAYRRSREAEARLRRLESAVGEFCEALRERVAVARTGAEEACRAEADSGGDAVEQREATEALGAGTVRQ
jgi:hypothetical protein